MSDNKKFENVNVIKAFQPKSLTKSLSLNEEEKTKIRESARFTLESLAKSLVDHPEDISVEYICGERTTIFKINCLQRNLGQIMCSKGKTISGLRAVISAITARQGIRSIVEIPFFEKID